ncbi:hypothetical protein B484DRAFT_473738, partial [Ochromonadaceae sp. CCMP2298]
ERVVREKAVVPWTKEDVWDDARAARLLAHLRTPEGKSQARKTAAMFPYEDIPLCVPSLGILRGRVEKLLGNLGNTDEDEIRESTRLLAVVKLNSHDDGCHGFGTFFNHSCSFNCEVRGATDMDVYCCRDISTGEEMSITYLTIDDLDAGVDIRRLTFALGWGAVCACARCRAEQPESPRMGWVNETLAPLTDAIGQVSGEASARLLLSLMTEVSLRVARRSREIFVLSHFAKRRPYLYRSRIRIRPR